MRRGLAAVLIFALLGGFAFTGVTNTPTAMAQGSGYECFNSDGTTISILGVWSGQEETNFRTILNPLLEACNITLSYEGTRDLNTVLATRVSGGAAPDIAEVPNPGSLADYADNLVPLDQVNVNADNYAAGWVTLGSVNGVWLGLPVKTDIKSLVWYSPANFSAGGFSIPTTWADFKALLDNMKNNTSIAPLAMGIESGGATGWPATDWVQDLLLREQGLDFVNGLVTGATAWNSQPMIDAWTQYVTWVKDYNPGGTAAALTTNYNDAILQPFQDPPQAWMVKQSGFAGSATIQPNFPNFVYGQDFAFFVLPGVDGNPAPMQVGADIMGVFNNTPAVQAVINYLSSAQGASAWAAAGFDLTPNSAVSTSDYADPISADKAQALANAPDVSFDVGDASPAEVGQAEFDNLTAAVGGGDIPTLLDNMEQTFLSATGMGTPAPSGSAMETATPSSMGMETPTPTSGS